MNKFLNRKEELAMLGELYDQQESRLVVVYGRRRLGKTTLLREFVQNKPSIYYMADRAGAVSQRMALSRSMSYALGEPVLGQARYETWYDLFSAFDRMRNKSERIVILLDEYQYLCQAESAFSSMLQKWWDEHWQYENVMLILCGSLTSMMYRETLTHSSPLYGRSHGQILLRPLPYHHIKDFVKEQDEVTCVERYALCGGIPRYLELLAPHRTFMIALKRAVLEPMAPLHAEARYLLQDEIDVPNVCWSLLEAIASGATRISEMASRLSQPANSLTRYLSLLRDLSIVEREVSVCEKNPSRSKRGIYSITDPFLRLWFGCIYPYESFFEIGRTDDAMEKVKPLLERHIQTCYEHLCRDYTRLHVVPGGRTVKVGRQWGAHYEINVAGVDSENRMSILGECKWSRRMVGLSVLAQLQETAAQQKLQLSPDIQWALFSRSGFTKELQEYARTTEDVTLIDSIFSQTVKQQNAK